MKLNLIKDKVQQEILDKVKEAKGWGILALATGVGKSRIPILYIDHLTRKHDRIKEPSVLIVVPTEKLRDENWKNEFYKWKFGKIWEKNVRRECYVSINKIHDQYFDLVVLDEGHNLTENNIKFFQQNTVDRCLLLTATLPKDKIKQDLIKSLKLPIIEEITLDQAVELKLIAPYEVKVIMMDLDNREKYIQAGNKKNPFMTTEYNQYHYFTKRIYDPELPSRYYQAMIYKRMNFIYDLKSKTEAARWLLKNVIPEDDRTLIFAGSIKQAEWLNKDYFHSKSDDKALNAFTEKKINRLSCVNALNEGMNLNDVDTGLIVQLNSKSLKLVQRMGRLLRLREDHTGTIYVLCVRNTVDEEWTKKALEDLNPENVEYIEFNKLRNGITGIT